MTIDFSGLNLHYLIQARDIAREDPERAAVLLGMSSDLADLLAQTTPEEIAPLTQIKVPLLLPRQEIWWWTRLFRAMREGRTEEVKAVIEHLSLITAP